MLHEISVYGMKKIKRMVTKMKLSELIKTYRQQNNISLRDFAQQCGLSHAYIDKLEKGVDSRNGREVRPSISTLQKIANAMNEPLEDLLKYLGIAKLYMSQEYNKKYTVKSNDIAQYDDFIKHAGAFFMNDKIADEDKEKLFKDLSELFWQSKELNKEKRRKKSKG